MGTHVISLGEADLGGRKKAEIENYHPYPGKKIQALIEAAILPEGAVKLAENLIPPEQEYTGTEETITYSRIPFILGDKVLVRTIESSASRTGSVINRNMQDGEVYCHRIYGGDTSFATIVEPMYRGEGVHLFPPAFQEIEINEKKGIIFSANHENRSPMFFYYADGDQKVIIKLKQLYAESRDLKIDETTDGIGAKVKEIFGRLLKKS